MGDGEKLNKDQLEHIFELQAKFDNDLARRRGLDFSDQALWVQREVLAMISELAELLDEVNFKWWKNPKEINREAVKEELVDILHFYVAACLRMNITAEELYAGYLEKNKENFQRQDGTSVKKGYEAPKMP